jgi:hypothetical protein
MFSSITALVTIRYQWVRVAGLDRLLMPLADNRNPSLTGTLVLPATHYDTSDTGFVEIAFSSPALELQGTIFVPKSEVISIVKTDHPDDLHKVGYKGRGQVEPMEAKSILDPAPSDLPS